MQTAAKIDIARAVRADTPTLSRVLARAFDDDPVFGWVIPDGPRRRTCLPSVFAAFAEAYLPHGDSYVAGNVGAALWAPAGNDPFTAGQAEAFGARIAEVLGDDAERAWEVTALLEQHHPSEPCDYLQFMGVLPEYQGHGVGSRLLTTVLQRCDATGTSAYLEATSINNRRLYQRHGFITLDEIALPQGPPLWPMWREPVTSTTA